MNADTPDDAFSAGPVRAFVYPGGGVWTVRVVQPEDGGPLVLRFTCGAHHLDLTDWPRDWVILPYEWLIALLRKVPRTGPPAPSGSPRRRWDDAAPTT